MEDTFRKTGRELLGWRKLNETVLRYMKGEENLTKGLRDGTVPPRDLDILAELPKPKDLFQEKINEVYSNLIRWGYQFETNSLPMGDSEAAYSLENQVKMYQSKGFDVVVGDRAFGRNGSEFKDMKAIFVKKIDVQ